MAPAKQVALEPALAEMLAQDLHYSPGRRNVVVDPDPRALEAAILHLEDVAQPVGVDLIGAEQAKIGTLGILRIDIAQVFPKLASGLMHFDARIRDLDGVVA